MKQIYFTRHRPPEYPPAPCPLAAGTGRRTTGPEPEAHACQGCGNCGGCGKCQHEEKQA